MLKIDYSNFDLDAYWKLIKKETFSKPKSDSTNITLLNNQDKLFNENRNSISLKSLYCFLQKDNDIFNKIFGQTKLKDIILIKADKLNNTIKKIEEEIKLLTVEEQKQLKIILKDVFQYSKFQGKILAPYFEKYLNPRTCYYCNIDFINRYGEEEIKKNGKKEIEFKNKFTLDHFIDKGRYPYLALSLFNLIPCCFICNSKKIKGSIEFYGNKKLENTNPYLKSFDFDEKVKFKLFLTESCKDLDINLEDDIDIKLKENYSNEYDIKDGYIDKFQLDERYEAHKDIVFEMIKNAELYPESRLKELQDLTGIPYQQIKKDIFNLIDDDVDLSKQPFSKLVRDISKELCLR